MDNSNSRIAIVILNYLNYKDTIECVESLEADLYINKSIIIVDNNSNNDSWKILNEKYSLRDDITLIKSDKNLGFAGGNNLGIVYAREKLKCNNVLLVNNDTIFEDKTMITTLMSEYEAGVAVIGPRIISANYKDQNPIETEVSKEQIEKEFKYFNSNKYRFKKTKIFKVLKNNVILARIKLSVDKNKKRQLLKKSLSKDLVLHGACMLLTKDYFEYYPFLFPDTFLYYEENILTLLTRKVNLKKKFVDSVYIYHKEDQSSEMSFENNDDIRLKYLANSMRMCNELFDLDYTKIIDNYFGG